MLPGSTEQLPTLLCISDYKRCVLRGSFKRRHHRSSFRRNFCLELRRGRLRVGLRFSGLRFAAAKSGLRMEPVDSARFPWLFVGGKKIARNEALLARHGIVYIVNCTPTCGEGGVANFHEKLTKSGRPVYRYLRVPLFDTSSESLSPYFALVWEFIESCRWREDGNLLIHCKRGVSRSVAMLCSYFIRHHDMEPDEALALIRRSTPSAKPNDSFLLQLKSLRSALLREANPEKRRDVAVPESSKRRRGAVGPSLPPSAESPVGSGGGGKGGAEKLGDFHRKEALSAEDSSRTEAARESGDASATRISDAFSTPSELQRSPPLAVKQQMPLHAGGEPSAVCRRERCEEAIKVQVQKC